jgi:DNA-binding PadR family transcriptional regulator
VADLLGAFEQAVLLAIVRAGQDAYGRSVLRGVEDGLGREVAAGAVYATLDRLEAQRLIGSRLSEGTAERAGRARRYYRLTASGVAALNDSKTALQRLWRGAKWPLGAKA